MPDTAKTEDSRSQDSVGEGDKSKLFFGKYKSLEEAEAGYKELERSFHAKAQEASAWKEVVDKLPADRGYERTGYVPSTSISTPDAGTELAEFYANPLGWKEKVKREAVEEVKRSITTESAQQNALAARINAWAEKNPDVAKHQDLLEVHVRRTDARLAPETRLDLAAGEVRKRLAELRGERAGNDKPDPTVMDGEAGRGRENVPQGQQQQQQQAGSAEAEMVKTINERNRNRIKRPGTHH